MRTSTGEDAESISVEHLWNFGEPSLHSRQASVRDGLPFPRSYGSAKESESNTGTRSGQDSQSSSFARVPASKGWVSQWSQRLVASLVGSIVIVGVVGIPVFSGLAAVSSSSPQYNHPLSRDIQPASPSPQASVSAQNSTGAAHSGPVPAGGAPLTQETTKASTPPLPYHNSSSSSFSCSESSQSPPPSTPRERDNRTEAEEGRRGACRPIYHWYGLQYRQGIEEDSEQGQCRMHRRLEQHQLTWSPSPHKFLLLYCTRGQVSNRVLCMRNHVLLAALLNRTLLLPSTPHNQASFPLNVSSLWDWERTRACFPSPPHFNTPSHSHSHSHILSTAEYERKFGHRLSVDRLLCWHGPKWSCKEYPPRRDEDCPAVVSPGFELNTSAPVKEDPSSLGTPSQPLLLDPASHLASSLHKGDTPIPAGGACLGQGATYTELLKAYGGVRERVLCVGDLVDRVPLLPLPLETVKDHSEGPLGFPAPFLHLALKVAPSCQPQPQSLSAGAGSTQERGKERGRNASGVQDGEGLLFGPPARVLSLAEEVMAVIGLRSGAVVFPYLGVHWRRGDYNWFCLAAARSTHCFYSSRQAASCVVRTGKQHGMRHVFLGTNAPEAEVQSFSRAVEHLSDKGILVVRANLSSCPSLSPVIPPGEPSMILNTSTSCSIINGMVDKVILARSSLFLGSSWSSFSSDVLSMRAGLGLLNCWDDLICSGEEEWDDSEGRTEDQMAFKRSSEMNKHRSLW